MGTLSFIFIISIVILLFFILFSNPNDYFNICMCGLFTVLSHFFFFLNVVINGRVLSPILRNLVLLVQQIVFFRCSSVMFLYILFSGTKTHPEHHFQLI